MNIKIEQYINEMFKNSDSDFREELISNYTEKYEALLKDNTPEDAYNKVIIDLQNIIENDQNNTLGTRKSMPLVLQFYWPLTVVIFFILSFIFGYEYTAVIFPIAGIIYYLVLSSNKKIAVRNLLIFIPSIFLAFYVMSYTSDVIGTSISITILFIATLAILSVFKKLNFGLTYWLSIVYIFIVISDLFNIWDYSFIIFIIAPFIYNILITRNKSK